MFKTIQQDFCVHWPSRAAGVATAIQAPMTIETEQLVKQLDAFRQVFCSYVSPV